MFWINADFIIKQRVHPIFDLGIICSIDDEDKLVPTLAIDYDVIKDTPRCIQNKRILCVLDLKTRDAVGGELVYKLGGTNSRNLEYAHMCTIKDSGCLSHGGVLTGYRRIPQWHKISGERDDV